jgi:hypothetical protein
MQMQVFSRLEGEILERWSRRNYDDRAFADIAYRALCETVPAEKCSGEDVVRWVLESRTLPNQDDVSYAFGQPPIMVAWNPRFYIQVLFWIDGSTTIHQHAFSGAFHVLEGSSLHSRYSFEQETRVSQQLLFGNLSFDRSELLTRGDTRMIEPGASFVHALFHLDRPSVSVVVRTHRDKEAGPQYDYHAPHVAWHPFDVQPLTVRRLQALKLLRTITPSAYLERCSELLAREDLPTAFSVLHQAVSLGVRADVISSLVGIVARQHGKVALKLSPVMDEIARQRFLVGRRRAIADPGERFFLATLLNLPDRASILQAVRERYPDRAAETMIASWIRGLNGKDEGEPFQTGCGESSFDVIERLVRVNDVHRVVDELRVSDRSLDIERAEHISTLCSSLIRSALLGRLFS